MRAVSLFLALALWAQAHTGSRACAPCHAEIVKRYATTPMARSGGPIASWARKPAAEVSQGAIRYRISGTAFTFEEEALRGERTLDWFVGSGAVGSSFLTSVDGWLFQAPVSWYTKAGTWGVSPGFEKLPGVSLLRPAEPACLRCHATSLNNVPGTTNQYRDPPFHEGGVGCERCHGPGDQHVRRKGTIVNPVKLDHLRRDSVCAQCHLSGATEIARGAGAASFRAGEWLPEKSVVFVWQNLERPMPVISHFERMTQSKCRQAEPEKFWCGTCHDPHGEPQAAATKAALFKQKCLSCHGGPKQGCTGPAATRRGDCVSCHMPKLPSAGVQHAAFTDHSIPRTPRERVSAVNGTSAPDLRPFGDVEATEGEYALAWADVAVRENNRTWGMKAWTLLQKVYAANPDDPRIAAQVAQLLERMGQQQKACAIWKQIATATAAASVNAGTCEAAAGSLDAATKHWRNALARSAGLEGARLNLAVALSKQGRDAEAVRELREALRFNPASKRASQLLKEIGPQ